MTKPETIPSAEEPQIPNKMELITLPTDMIEFLYEKVSRDLGSKFVYSSRKFLKRNLKR